jgi:mannitol/fructose-specific phosphotransferase system IIA component (Ntr-type)
MRASDVEGTHMRVFSKLARKLMHADFRERMLAARDSATLIACLADELELGPDDVAASAAERGDR